MYAFWPNSTSDTSDPDDSFIVSSDEDSFRTSLSEQERSAFELFQSESPLCFTQLPPSCPAPYNSASSNSIFRNSILEEQVNSSFASLGMPLPQSITSYYSNQRQTLTIKIPSPETSPRYTPPSYCSPPITAPVLDSMSTAFPFPLPNQTSKRRNSLPPKSPPHTPTTEENPLITQLLCPKYESMHDPALKSFPCACGKRFERLCGLKSHVKVHVAKGHTLSQALNSKLEWKDSEGVLVEADPEDSGRKHICQKCPKNFLRKQDLRRHVQSAHSGSFKHLQCTSCGSRFSRSDALHRHVVSKRCKT